MSLRLFFKMRENTQLIRGNMKQYSSGIVSERFKSTFIDIKRRLIWNLQ